MKSRDFSSSVRAPNHWLKQTIHSSEGVPRTWQPCGAVRLTLLGLNRTAAAHIAVKYKPQTQSRKVRPTVCSELRVHVVPELCERARSGRSLLFKQPERVKEESRQL